MFEILTIGLRYRRPGLALSFAAIGIFLFLRVALPPLWDYNRMQSWIPANAQLIAAHLHEISNKNAVIQYDTTATYSYSINGIDYSSSRVDINQFDDSNGFRYQLGLQLEKALQDKQSISIWVNPTQPGEAVIDRRLHWYALFKHIIYSSGSLGIGIFLFAIFKKNGVIGKSDTVKKVSQPLSTASIRCTNTQAFWAVLALTVVCNLVSATLLAFIPDLLFSGQHIKMLLALIFPMMGLLLAGWVFGAWLKVIRYGPTYFLMNPYPGAINGLVRGRIELPLPYNAANLFEAKLTCLQTTYRRESRNHDVVIWCSEHLAAHEPGKVGTDLNIRFNVPDNLPQSQLLGHIRYHWELSINCRELGFNQEYDIPVFAVGAQPSIPESSAELRATPGIHHNKLDEILFIKKNKSSIELHFPMFRQAAGAAFGFPIALAFLAGAYLVTEELLISIVFFGLGALLFARVFYMISNTLDVKISREGIISRRKILGLFFSEKTCSREKCINFIITTSNRYYYNIHAVLANGKKIIIAEGIEGLLTAESAVHYIAELTGYEDKVTTRTSDSTAP